MDIFGIMGSKMNGKGDGIDTTTCDAEQMPESKTARQKVNEKRVFKNLPDRMNASERLDSSFDE